MEHSKRSELSCCTDDAPNADRIECGLSCCPSQVCGDSVPSPQEISSTVSSIRKCGAESAAASQSTGLTADVDRMLDMSLTDNADSISSPLLTPGEKRESHAGGSFHLPGANADAKTVSPKLAVFADKSKKGLETDSSPAHALCEPAVTCTLSHATPISAVQTGSTSRSSGSSCPPNSRIPSSSRTPHLLSDGSCSNLPTLKTSFSFAAHALQDAATPKGIGAHQIWNMGQTSSAVPQLHLAHADVQEVYVNGLSQWCAPKDYTMQQDPDAITQAGSQAMLAVGAISALTPVANEVLMVSEYPGMAPKPVQQIFSDKSRSLRPPAHPASLVKPHHASRIPSRRGRGKHDLADASVECTTPTIARSRVPADKGTDKLVNLMPGSVEPPCPSDAHPPNHSSELHTEPASNGATAIGTPPYAKLMRFLSHPTKKCVGDCASDEALANTHCKEVTSPVIPATTQMSSMIMCTGMTPDGRPFSQLLKDIQADRYRSPAVNCAAFHGIQQVGISPSSTASTSQPQDDSPSVIHSEIGENYPDASDLEGASCGQAQSPVMAAVQDATGDVCCSRVSVAGHADGAVSEPSVDLFSKASMKIITSSAHSPISRSSNAQAGRPASLRETPSPVMLTLMEQNDESGQATIKVSVDVRDTPENPDSVPVPPLALAMLRHEVCKDAQPQDSAPTQYNTACGVRESTAISCTVNIGEITPRSPDGVADASSVPELTAPESPATDVCNISTPDERPDSAINSISAARAHEVRSPPHLSISLESVINDAPPDPASEMLVSPVLNDGVLSPIKSVSPDPNSTCRLELTNFDLMCLLMATLLL